MLSTLAARLISRQAVSLTGRPSLLQHKLGGRTRVVYTATTNAPSGILSRVSHLSTLGLQSTKPILDPNAEWARMSKEASKSDHTPMNAYSGRSVRVFNGNLTDAFRKLDGILARNKVRAQLRLGERHEQKGAKRRRLSSERWRKRFAHEVRQKVQLVQKIRRRGA
ncbi:hypothetical protein AX17_003287 [Amanita inopinata Kibby_2008]|nr:hypothetical protein AX17_003287 [Amanita inopinata Kibby_2008]